MFVVCKKLHLSLLLFAAILFFPSETFAAVIQFTGAEAGSGNVEVDLANGTIQSSVVKNGSFAYRFNPSGASVQTLSIRPNATTTGYFAVSPDSDLFTSNTYLGFWLRVDTFPLVGGEQIVRGTNTSNQTTFILRLNYNRTLSVLNNGLVSVATTTTALATSTWYYVNLRVDAGTGAQYDLRINGSTDVSGTSTFGGTANTMRAVSIGKPQNTNSNTLDLYFDDIVLDDSTFGTSGQKVLALMPNAIGTYNEWSSNATNTSRVSERPHDSNTTTVDSSADGQRVSWHVTDTAAAGITGTINAVKGISTFRENAATTGTGFQTLFISSTTQATTTSYDGSGSYTGIGKFYLNDPHTGSAWTLAGLDNVQIGAVAATSLTTFFRITQASVQVLFTPPVDNTAPVISSVASSTAQTTATISWSTDELATSTLEYGTTPSFGTATSSNTATLSHSYSLTGLATSTLYYFRISVADPSNNLATSTTYTFLTQDPDTTPPVVSNGSPSGTILAGTATTSISVSTDEVATCKYSTSPGTAYGAMTSFSNTASTTHIAYNINGLGNNRSYNFYVKCQDTFTNTNSSDYTISFTIPDYPAGATFFWDMETDSPVRYAGEDNTPDYNNSGNPAVRSLDYAYAGSYSLKTTQAFSEVTFEEGTNNNVWAPVSEGTVDFYWKYIGPWSSKMLFQVTGKATLSSNPGLDTNDGFVLRTGPIDQPGVFRLSYCYDNCNTTVNLSNTTSPVSLVEGQWYRFTVRYNTNGPITLSTAVDGVVLATSTTALGSTTAQAWHQVLIGNDTTSTSTQYFDNFSICPRATGDCGADLTPPVISSVASSTTATTATITWTTDEAATSSVSYGTTLSYGSASSSSATTTSHSITLTGLSAGTTYNFRVGSQDAAGNATTSQNYTFTTSVNAPTLTTSAASSVAQTSATLNGSITATGGANATQSGFAYGTSSSLTTNVSTSTLGAQTGTASFNEGVTGLTCNTTYYFRAYATNTGGTGYGSITSFITSACAGTVTTQSASSLTLSSATLNGNITATGGANATVRGFAYGLTTAYGATTTEAGSFGTGAYTADISNLTCNTTYNFRSYSTNTAGTSYGSNTTLTTSACAAPTLTTSAATSLTKTTGILNASITATGGNDATQSGFAYGTTSALTFTIATSTLGAQSGAVSFTESLSDLTCETTYYFRPYATNITGTSYGSITSFTTSSCTDPVVTTVTQNQIPSSSARRIASNLASRVTTFFGSTPSASTVVSTPTLSSFIEALISAGIVPADKIEAARAVVTAAAPTGISAASFKRDLQLRDKGEDVKTLQTLLISKGFLAPGNNTGTFGPLTFRALKQYQSSVGVPSTGYFGPLSRGSVGR